MSLPATAKARSKIKINIKFGSLSDDLAISLTMCSMARLMVVAIQ